jgi:penicillin-binding protein 2
MFGIGLTVLVLSLRLFQLTIVKGAYYRRLSEENRVKEITIDPKRGSIIDRKGFVIAENKEADVSSGHERISSRRLYEAGEETAHLIGYRQLADRADIKNDNCVNRLKLGDKVGKKGVEQLFDCELRGVAGKKLVEVDAVGEYLRTLTVVPPRTAQPYNWR